MRKAIPTLIFWSGLLGLAVAACLGLLQWRIIWKENRAAIEGGFLIDWSPYPNYLTAAMNWWVPFSVLICAVSLFLTLHSKRRVALVLGWCFHAISTIGLVSLALWVFSVPLEGAASGVWWMYWNK
jgi:hypothetical protein